jgi:DinB family protein
MNAKDAFKISMDMSDYVLKTYVSDLTDAELLTHAVKGANHLAWQLGHLISSEQQLLNGVCPGAAADLPAGFADQHNKETIGIDDPKKFLAKSRYIELYDQQRSATKAALDKLSESDFDKPGPDQFKDFAPTVGAVFNLIASHPMMHVGQFATARRALGKPVLI